MKTKTLTQVIFILIALTWTTINLQGQVTIGSSQPPMSGALLDLTEGVNTTKGLSLPRVVLSELKPTTDSGLAQSIGNASGSYSRTDHIGLVVYNTKDPEFNKTTCRMEGAPKGLYVWDGTEWQQLDKKAVGAKQPDKRTVSYPAPNKMKMEYIENGNIKESREYYFATFGTAGTWMTENLATMYLPDGTQLTLTKGASGDRDLKYFIPGSHLGITSITGAQGLLYNWTTAMNKNTCTAGFNQAQVAGSIPGANEVETLNESSQGAKDGSIQGICPSGWHVPSDREWNELEKEITTSMSQYTQTPLSDLTWTAAWETVIVSSHRGDYPNGHGKAMMAKGSTINGFTTIGDSKTAQNGGFDALMVGVVIDFSSSYTAISYGPQGYFWSASAQNGYQVWARALSYDGSDTGRLIQDTNSMFSLRCKKD